MKRQPEFGVVGAVRVIVAGITDAKIVFANVRLRVDANYLISLPKCLFALYRIHMPFGHFDTPGHRVNVQVAALFNDPLDAIYLQIRLDPHWDWRITRGLAAEPAGEFAFRLSAEIIHNACHVWQRHKQMEVLEIVKDLWILARNQRAGKKMLGPAIVNFKIHLTFGFPA